MKKELIVYRDPKSPVSEMFRTLRTNIQFMNADKQLKTLLITSTLPEEGKSWVAANLAITFAQAGKRVLIVDADMRKGRQFNIFDVSPIPGLSNYLSGVVEEKEKQEHNIEDFIQDTDVDNLFILTSGSVPPNPSELLVSERMLGLLDWVKQIFDIVIFDGTPSLLVTDATILSRIVDSTIIVTAHNETKLDNVEEVKKGIENIGGKVAGVVINKIPISAKRYEKTYYYGSSSRENQTKDKRKNVGNYKEYEDTENKNMEKFETVKQKIKNMQEEQEDVYKTIEPYENEYEEEPEKVETDKTQDILNQIKDYLTTEKNNLKNGEKND